MPTIVEVDTAVRARVAANFTAIDVRYKNEDVTLPDTPAAFVYVEIVVARTELAGFGGGRLNNLWRTFGQIEAQFFAPVGQGIAAALTSAEQFCAVFRSQRVDSIDYLDAEVFPATGQSEDGTMALIATAVIDLQFDKVG